MLKKLAVVCGVLCAAGAALQASETGCGALCSSPTVSGFNSTSASPDVTVVTSGGSVRVSGPAQINGVSYVPGIDTNSGGVDLNDAISNGAAESLLFAAPPSVWAQIEVNPENTRWYIGNTMNGWEDDVPEPSTGLLLGAGLLAGGYWHRRRKA